MHGAERGPRGHRLRKNLLKKCLKSRCSTWINCDYPRGGGAEPAPAPFTGRAVNAAERAPLLIKSLPNSAANAVPLSQRCPQLTCPPATPQGGSEGSSGSNPTRVPPPPGSSAPEHQGPRSVPWPAPGLRANARPLHPGAPDPAPCPPSDGGGIPESSEAQRTKGAGRDLPPREKVALGSSAAPATATQRKLEPCPQRG